jgi:hypothetical protein
MVQSILDTSSSSALMCGRGFLVTVWYARMLYHIGLRATTADTLSYMICRSYWKIYHWKSQHECGTCMMVLRHILTVLCEMFTITRIMTDGYVEENPLHSLHAPRRIWILWIFTCGTQTQHLLTTKRHSGCLSDYPQLPRHLWTDAALPDETCRGVHWISWGTFWALIIEVLFQL